MCQRRNDGGNIMYTELNQRNHAMTGRAVKDFTAVESALSVVGNALDALISVNDNEDYMSAAADLYLKLTSLQAEVGYFVDDVNNHFKPNEAEGEDSSEQSK